jgi:hypothetical protein
MSEHGISSTYVIKRSKLPSSGNGSKMMTGEFGGSMHAQDTSDPPNGKTLGGFL